MRKIVLLLVLAGCLPVAAQDMDMSPAEELEKYEITLGRWEGSGTVRSSPDAEESGWKASGIVRWVLDGHFIQRDYVVTFESGDYPPLTMRSFGGWNGETNRYVNFGIDSMGTVYSSEVHFVSDNVMVASQTMMREGVPIASRSVSRYKGDTYSFKIERAIGDGDFFTHVEGTFQRQPGDPAEATLPVSRGAGAEKPAGAQDNAPPVPDEMSRLASLTGKWRFSGMMIPYPGADYVSISAVETVTPLYGGRVSYASITSDPDEQGFVYEGRGYLGWDEQNQCYQHFWLDNMGGSATDEARWDGDDQLVFTGHMVQFGKPVVGRSVMKFDEDGKPASVYHDVIMGASPATRVFVGSYKRAE